MLCMPVPTVGPAVMPTECRACFVGVGDGAAVPAVSWAERVAARLRAKVMSMVCFMVCIDAKMSDFLPVR